MNTILHKSNSRGFYDHGWLQTHHTFSFAGYHNSERMRFGKLRVLNDDIVAPGMGFGTHAHDNMEIVSVPIYGALAHSDNQGHEQIIRENDVQVMSAGTGIYHSEYNPSDTDPANFLQLWIFPDQSGHKPRYAQKRFDPQDRLNNWQYIVTPDKNNGALWLNQRAWLALADLDAGSGLQYTVHDQQNGVYIFIISGAVNINNTELNVRDGLGIWEAKEFTVNATIPSRILTIEIPM